MDLLSIVPYYTGHLCAALARRGAADVHVELGSIRYYLDPLFFRRAGVCRAPGVVDAVSQMGALPALLRRPLKLAEYLLNLAILAARVRARRIDALHVQFLPLLNSRLPVELRLLAWAKSSGVRVIATVHNVLPHDTGERLRSRYQALYRLADRLICHDASARERLVAEFGIDPERVEVIPHGPLFDAGNKPSRTAARHSLGLSATENIVLLQGILRPYKGAGILLRAWAKATQAGLNARLLVAGTGDAGLERELREQAAALGIAGSVDFHFRFVTFEELEQFYSAADVLVYPYTAVTSSGALMTGIGFGRAIIASRLPAFEQVLGDGSNALMVSPADVESLAAALTRMFDEAGLLDRLAAGTRATRRSVPSWEAIADSTLACYRTALSGGIAPRPAVYAPVLASPARKAS